MSPITAASRFRQSERVINQEAGGTTVLLSLEGGQYYSLNGVGGRAWELADGSRTVSELAVLLESEFDAPAGVIERDLLELFSNLADEKLVTQDQAESGGI
ncbi:MAG: PqqD family protein [Verrucomicrobiota bacterium]